MVAREVLPSSAVFYLDRVVKPQDTVESEPDDTAKVMGLLPFAGIEYDSLEKEGVESEESEDERNSGWSQWPPGNFDIFWNFVSESFLKKLISKK